MKAGLLALAVAATLAAPVAAEDWTGPYAGLGVGRGDVDGPGAQDGDGTTYGLHAGYDYDMGSVVLGAELEYNWADIELGGGGVVDTFSRLKLRAGYDFGPALGYVVAGTSRADTSLGDETGAVYGLGVAYALRDGITLSGEWLRDDFDTFGIPRSDLTSDSFNLRASFRF
ncbi:outer membrane protein [Pseudooceanicola sp.]|uniref:outer membrane protein n=1 Tax=Pseudooceanicola sp. TaxID=1914328 RepID=UPI003511B65C